MALIVLEGPGALDAARAFHENMGWAAWDLEPDLAQSVRLDVPCAITASEAIAYVEKCAFDPDFPWLEWRGWNARFMKPIESDSGIPGRQIL